MAIRNLEEKVWDSFRGGRFTRNNLVKISDDHLLIATNLIMPGDGVAHRRPGYTLVTPNALGFVPTRIFDFERQSDGSQFVFVSGAGHFGYINPVSGAYTELSNNENPAPFAFATSVFACYASNGVNAYKLVDVNGVLTKWNWGIKAPTVAPGISVSAIQAAISAIARAANVVTVTLSAPPSQAFQVGDAVNVSGVTDASYNGTGFILTAVTGGGLTLTWAQVGANSASGGGVVGEIRGTLTLVKGRQYCYSFVSKWTDSEGVTRVHVGPPSPISAHTGPVTDGVVNGSGIQVSTDPQVTHIWVFETNDTPLNTTSVFYFSLELTNGTTSFGDTLADTALDTTRQAPFDNLPAPPGTALVEYQQRIAVMGIAGKPNLVQASGLEEVDLGIPQETFPLTLFFNVPGGIKSLVGGCVFNQSLELATNQFWFQVTGFSAETFTERDKIYQPGAAGPEAIALTNTWKAWIGVDKKIWAVPAGSTTPIEVSWKIARADGSGQLSMESMNALQLANAQLRWYGFGRYSILAAFVSTQNNNVYDWMQLWDTTALTGPQGAFGPMTQDGMLMGAAETDAFLNDPIVATGIVLVQDTPYIFMADSLGFIYRWPDGATDNGEPIMAVGGSEFSDLGLGDGNKHMRWIDIRTSRVDAAQAFRLSAQVSTGVNINTKPVALPMGAIPDVQVDPTCARGKMDQQKATSVGRMLRWFCFFPPDDQEAKLYAVTAKATPLGGDSK